MTEEESQTQPVIISASVHSVSPPPSQLSPVLQHSPAALSAEENSETSAQGSTQHHDDDGPVLDEPHIRVSVLVFVAFSLS